MHQTAKRMRESGIKQVRIHHNRARSTAMKRKEEYLGARVPKELREKVIARADKLGIPVSILIRNILEESFSLPAGVNSETDIYARQQDSDVSNFKENDEYPTVIGWEIMTLNKTMTCSGCREALKAGATVTLGLAGPGESHVILCGKCKKIA